MVRSERYWPAGPPSNDTVALFKVRHESQKLELEVSEQALSDHSVATIVKALAVLNADEVLRLARGQRVLLNTALRLVPSPHAA